MEAPLSRIINVSLLGMPQGLANFNVNSLALFTDEAAGAGFGGDGYKIYTSPDEVASDFGSDSETAAQAIAIFSQSPNIITGNGYLVVIPLLTIAENTSGSMLTLKPGTLAHFQTIEDGAFNIAVDGVTQNITGLDFSDAEDFDDVATIVSAAVTGDTCTYDEAGNGGEGGFLFTSSSTGAASTVSKLTSPASGTDLSGSYYPTGTANVRILTGHAASDTEGPVAALVRAKDLVYFFGILFTPELETTRLFNLAGYVQALDKMFFLGRSTEGEIETIFEVIQSGSLTHTRGLYYTLGTSEARVAAAAYASRLLGINFDGSNTMSTMHLKTLSGIVADPDAASDTVDNQAKQYGFDIYVSIAGDPGVLSYGANGYSDEIYGQLWLKLALQVAGYNFLKLTSTKVPQTETGMDGLKGAYASVCRQALNNGLIGAGLTWTSATTFGNPEDLRRNIKDAGYYLYSLPVSQQSVADRAARKAPLVQIAAKFAGAIHHSDVVVQVN